MRVRRRWRTGRQRCRCREPGRTTCLLRQCNRSVYGIQEVLKPGQPRENTSSRQSPESWYDIQNKSRGISVNVQPLSTPHVPLDLLGIKRRKAVARLWSVRGGCPVSRPSIIDLACTALPLIMGPEPPSMQGLGHHICRSRYGFFIFLLIVVVSRFSTCRQLFGGHFLFKLPLQLRFCV